MARQAARCLAAVLVPTPLLALHLAAEAPRCLDAKRWWGNQLNQKYGLGKYSQCDQDEKLASLFSDENLGTTNKFYVEFGWTGVGNSQTERLKVEQNWTGFRMDDSCSARPGAELDNCYKAWISGDNIVSLFRNHSSPREPDYVSIDIDSTDVWVFSNLTKSFRPRVMTVEYASKFNITDTVPREKQSSLGAVAFAAQQSGYSLVGVEPSLDAFLVRSDLVCPGTEVQLSEFARFTSLNGPHEGTPKRRHQRSECRPENVQCPMDWTLKQFPCVLGTQDFCSTPH